MTLTHPDAFELARLIEGTSAGAQIPEIVRRGLQDLLEVGVSAAIGAQRHQRCPEERTTHRSGYRERSLSPSALHHQSRWKGFQRECKQDQ
jgi:putative transposase